MRLEKSSVESVLNVHVEEMKPYRNQWMIQAKDEKWIAKESRSSRHWIWWTQVDQVLRRRGFVSMPPFKMAQKWVFTSFIEGRTAKYTNIADVIHVTQTLAKFHVTAQRIFVPVRRESVLFFERIYRRLMQFYTILQDVHSIEGELGELLNIHGRDMYLEGRSVWEQLRASALWHLTARDCWMGNIAHRDLASHNWMIDASEKAWLIDWDTAEYDLQLGDFWQMSTRMFTENCWEEEIVDSVFSAYQSVRPLTYLEKRVLVLLLAFPNEFYREAIGLAKKKKGYKEKNVIPYLRKIIAARATWQEQLKRLGNR